jgi:soluble lytic murein transglycosylase-like protein
MGRGGGNLRHRSAVCIAVSVMLCVSPAKGTEGRTVAEVSARWAEYYAAVYHVPVELVEAIIDVESGWNPYAVSDKGAVGLMQLMPETANRFGLRNRFVIEENIRGGVAYLDWLMRLFHGDLRLVVAGYYAGEQRILPRGLAYSSRDTYEYVRRVATIYRARRLAEGNNKGAKGQTAVEQEPRPTAPWSPSLPRRKTK